VLTRLAIPFALIAMLVMGFSRNTPENSERVDGYHERIAQILNEIPIEFDGWVGQQVPLPQSAIQLLDPNALVARHFINQEKGVSATLLVVQCRDARDMAGHYPPQCYPASGWLKSKENPVSLYTLNDGPEVRVYGFERVAGQMEAQVTIYSLFALPTGELTWSMDDVRRLSADYRYRQFGAAQVQILIDGDVPADQHDWILNEMFEVAMPSINAVLDALPELKQSKEGAK
tara:strand:+ start:1125 stop:1817 length:693 start_codon:yes stop_codon:yes gene_type:complete